MGKKIILLLATFVVAFVFCGAVSAATVINSDTNTVKLTNVGTATDDQYYPAINSNRVVSQQDSSLQSVYVKNPPRVTSTNPVNNSLNIPTTKLIVISFSRLIYDPNNSLIQLKSSSGRNVPITYSIKYNALYIDHSPLQKGTTYTLLLKPNFVKDVSGYGLTSNYTTKFKTGNNNLNFKAQLIIPKLGTRATIRSDTLNAYNAVYHYPNSAYFGTPGECAMIGHRTTYSAVLRYINLLNAGDSIIIKDYTANKLCTYKVVYHEILMNYQLKSTFKLQGESVLILKSCYPVGRSYAKYVVHGKLVSTVSLS